MLFKKYYLFLTLAVLAGVVACSRDDDMAESIQGKWRCVGWCLSTSSSITPVNPHIQQENGNMYTISFEKNGIVHGHTGANEFSGRYNVFGNVIRLMDIEQTLEGIIGETIDYEDVLFHSIETYEIRSRKLMLFFDNGQKYLLFVNTEE